MLTLTALSPAPGEKLVPLDSPIEFTIVDDGTGIDISTLIVEVRGFRAITNADFQDGYDGPLSVITPNADDFIVVIDPESAFLIGSVVDVKIQVKNLDGMFFNKTYSFRVIPEEPVLTDSSPSEKQILTSPQILYLEFEDFIDGVDASSVTVKINGLNYITDGVIDPELNDSLSAITTESTVLMVRIDPNEALRDGNYILSYSVSDPAGNALIGDISFTVKLKEAILPGIFPQTGFLGFFQGIKRISDIGCGDSLLIEWNKPIKRYYKTEVFVIVYEDESRLSTFDSPKYITRETVEGVTLSGFETSKSRSFGARALEIEKDVFDFTGMVELTDEFYQLPGETSVSSQIDEADLIIPVDDVTGYPEAGLLIVGREVIRYNSVDRINNRFLVPVNGRGGFGTIPSIYIPGDEIKLFLECTDSNTVIILGTPTFQDGYASGRDIDMEGLVVFDPSDNDSRVFEGFDFCGYHQTRPQDALTGSDKSCGSYLGGEFNGFRGFDVVDRMISREEVLLDQTGEPMILLKRIWDGETCSCVDARKVHPKMRSCNECFGTGFIGGFDQYGNLRRADRRIMVALNENPEDLLLKGRDHLTQMFEPTGWTIPTPAIRDRDILVRFDFTDDIEFFYEVLDVGREKILFRKFGRQTLRLKRLDKTDIVYTYPLNLGSLP